MCFLYFLIVGCSPASDAVEAEAVGTVLQDSESSSLFEDFVQADDALLVAFVFNQTTCSDFLGWFCFNLVLHALWMHVLAVITELAIAGQEPLAYDPLRIVFQKVINCFIVFICQAVCVLCACAAGACVHHLIHRKVNRIISLFIIKCARYVCIIFAHEMLQVNNFRVVAILARYLPTAYLYLSSEVLEHVYVCVTKFLLDLWVQR